jgi:hypothetical protein
MSDLQSDALATWPRRRIFWKIKRLADFGQVHVLYRLAMLGKLRRNYRLKRSTRPAAIYWRFGLYRFDGRKVPSLRTLPSATRSQRIPDLLAKPEGIAQMKQLFAKLLNQPSAEVVESIVRQVAEQSVAGVCERVEARVVEMTLPEARGYVRARAAEIVRRQTRATITRHPGSVQDMAEVIVQAATERLVPVVLRQTNVGVPRPQELPMVA